MFNVLFAAHELFLLTLGSFFVIFTTRHLFIKKKTVVVFYHLSLFSILFIASIGGGSVQNDAYSRLEQFILLEKNNQLDLAKQDPKNYDSMFRIDLHQFKDSAEFKEYLTANDIVVDKAEAISIGWLFTFLAEISMVFIQLISYVRRLLQKYNP